MDIALSIDNLLHGAKYGGSLTGNTKEQFDSLRWEDERQKPTWQEINNSWQDIILNNKYNVNTP